MRHGILTPFIFNGADMSRDEPVDIPSFGVSRDEGVTSAPRGAVPPSRRGGGSNGGGGAGIMTRLAATIGFVIAAVACAWAFQLQQALDASTVALNATSARVSDLEALLSDTEESTSQSAAAMGAQLKIVDKETRRLEQRRREMDTQIDKLEKSAAAATSELDKLKKSVASYGGDIKSMNSDLASLKKVANDLERLASTARQSQEGVERLADGLNKSNLDTAALNKRVKANEEWIESINAFRRQMNAKITSLEQAVRQSGGTVQ